MKKEITERYLGKEIELKVHGDEDISYFGKVMDIDDNFLVLDQDDILESFNLRGIKRIAKAQEKGI